MGEEDDFMFCELFWLVRGVHEIDYIVDHNSSVATSVASVATVM